MKAATSPQLIKDPECWSGQESNPRPPARETGAQPTEPPGRRLIILLVLVALLCLLTIRIIFSPWFLNFGTKCLTFYVLIENRYMFSELHIPLVEQLQAVPCCSSSIKKVTNCTSQRSLAYNTFFVTFVVAAPQFTVKSTSVGLACTADLFINHDSMTVTEKKFIT